MRELKSSRQALVAYGLLGALGMGPQALQKPALELFSRKATVVATNVPGPQQPLYLAGRASPTSCSGFRNRARSGSV